jgi:hypothetical protein
MRDQYPYNVFFFFFLQLYQLENKIFNKINTEQICVDREPNSILAFLGLGVRIFLYH